MKWQIIDSYVPTIIITFIVIITSVSLFIKARVTTRIRNAFVRQEYRCLIGESSTSSILTTPSGGGLPSDLRREQMPRHVAVILDGNRRWAKHRKLTHVEGYNAGFLAVKDFLRLCGNWDIPIVSLYMFSSENWQRPKAEVDYLLELFEKSLRDGLSHSMSKSEGARVSVIGDTSLFPDSLQEALKQVQDSTKNNTKYHVILAASYSGQNDIAQACQRIATKVKDGILKPEDVTKSLVEKELHTKVTDVPSPDLLIRTSGELRVSNFYLWQSAYTELYFTDTLLPDFGEQEFIKALCWFQQRGSRFGRR